MLFRSMNRMALPQLGGGHAGDPVNSVEGSEAATCGKAEGQDGGGACGERRVRWHKTKGEMAGTGSHIVSRAPESGLFIKRRRRVGRWQRGGTLNL